MIKGISIRLFSKINFCYKTSIVINNIGVFLKLRCSNKTNIFKNIHFSRARKNIDNWKWLGALNPVWWNRHSKEVWCSRVNICIVKTTTIFNCTRTYWRMYDDLCIYNSRQNKCLSMTFMTQFYVSPFVNKKEAMAPDKKSRVSQSFNLLMSIPTTVYLIISCWLSV